MVEYIDYKPEHAREIVSYGAVGICNACAEQVDLMARVKLNGVSFTTVFDGRIVACAGIETMWAGVGQAWALCVYDIGEIHMNPRENRNKFIEIAKPYHRVQAPLRADLEAGISFAEYMGFKQESIMKQYYSDKVDALMYVLGDI